MGMGSVRSPSWEGRRVEKQERLVWGNGSPFVPVCWGVTKG